MVEKFAVDGLYKIAKKNITIFISFFILAILSSIYFFKTNIVFNSWDFGFHYARIYEMHQSIVYGNGLPKVMLNTFLQNGSATMIMYPDMNLLFTVFISFFIKSFSHLIYAVFILRNFFALSVSYFSCYSFNKNKKISFIFSVTYILSAFTLHFNFSVTDLGVSTSLIFLPLVIFGTFSLIENKSWKQLAVGISMVIFSHIITAVLAIFLVIIIILINYKKVDKKFLKSLEKSVGITLLITSCFTISFIIMSMCNQISMPDITWPLSGVDFNELISNVFSNSVGSNYIGIVAFIGLIISIVNYRHLPKYSKQIFWISVSIMVIVSPLFPWSMLNNTFIRPTFQRSYRLYVIAQALLTYLFAENVIMLCKNRKQKIITIIAITITVIVAQISGQKYIIDSARQNSFNSENIINTLNNETSYYIDYFPKKAIPLKNNIMNHWGTYDDDKKTTVKLLGNGTFSFNITKPVTTFNMPFVMYNSINYQVKIDGKTSKFYSSNRSQLTLIHLSKGKHIVQVIVHKSWYDYLSYILSALGVIILAFAWIRSLILKRKNK